MKALNMQDIDMLSGNFKYCGWGVGKVTQNTAQTIFVQVRQEVKTFPEPL